MIFYLVIVLLLAIGITVLLGSHYLLYISTVYFFDLSGTPYDKALFAALSLGAVSFILASIIAHVKENTLTRLFYLVSGFWLGLLANLILALGAIWTILGLASLVGTHPNPAALAKTFYALALVFSAWGAWNAMNPKLKNITATIPNLPERWRGKKIIQLSDIHIGHVYKNNYLKKITKLVNSARPDLVVITGDLFDGMDGDLREPLKELDQINSAKGVFFITGNHETILGTKVVHEALDSSTIRAMRDEVIDIDGLKLIGINYPEHGETRDAVAILKNLEKEYLGQPNVLLHHSPVNIQKFKEGGINLQLSGHTHKAQMFPLNYLLKIIFKGYEYGLYAMGDYTLYVTSGAGTWGPAMRTNGAPEVVVVTLQ